MTLLGTYAGVVESVKDPERLGRVKARVPHVHGTNGSGAGYIGTNDLPWAMPAGMPAGGQRASGGFSHLPANGDHVWVRFLDGEPEKPVWEWGMQTFDDRDAQKIHTYDLTGGKVGNPTVAFWTRYGHAYEINATGLIASTSTGYRIQIIDGQPVDGSINLETALGNSIKIDDLDQSIRLFSNLDMRLEAFEGVYGYSNSFNWTTLGLGFIVDSGAEIALTSSTGIALTTAGDLLLDSVANGVISSSLGLDLISTLVRIGQATAVEPLVLGIQLTAFLNALLTWLTTHTHGNGNNGSPTTPPIIPPTISVPSTALLTSKTVFTT